MPALLAGACANAQCGDSLSSKLPGAIPGTSPSKALQFAAVDVLVGKKMDRQDGSSLPTDLTHRAVHGEL